MGNIPDMAMKTIEMIEDFYENTMGVPTHICQYNVSQDRAWIEQVVKKFVHFGDFGVICRFTDKNLLLGENKKITPEVVGRLIEDSY